MDGFADTQVAKQQQQCFQPQSQYVQSTEPQQQQQQQYQLANQQQQQQKQMLTTVYANQQIVQPLRQGDLVVSKDSPMQQQQRYTSTGQQQQQPLVYATQSPAVANQLRQQQQMPLTMTYAQNSAPMPSAVQQTQYGVGDISMALANNAAVGGYGGRTGLFGGAEGGVDGNRQAVEFTKFDVEPKQAMAEHITKELKEHWAQVEKLNLLDGDRLDQLYVYHDVLHDDKKLLFEYLYSEYREKYGDLFNTYLSVEIYVIYVLLVLVYGSEQVLKESCADGFVQTPRAGGSSLKLRQFSRKRAAADFGDDAAKRTLVNAEETPVAAEIAADRPKHPFYGETLYTAHSSLFKVGEMTKYCVPSEFAVLFCSLHLSVVSVYKQGDKKTQHNGIRLAFSKPIVSLVRSRNYKSYTFQSLERFGALGDIMSAVTGRQIDQEPFRLSSLKEMKMKDLTTQQTLSTLKWDGSVGYNMAIINTFSCTDTNVGILNIRAFSSPIYHVAKGHIDVNEDKLSDMYEKASNHTSYVRRTNELNEHYDRVEEGEPVAK